MTLEKAADPLYIFLMDDLIDKSPPATWVEALDCGLADIESGRIAPMSKVLDRGRAAIARLQTRQQDQDKLADSKA